MPDKVKSRSHFNLALALALNLFFGLVVFYILSFVVHLYVYEADKDHYDKVTQITHRLEIEFFQNKTHLLARVVGKNSSNLKEALRINKETEGSFKLLSNIRNELSAALVYLINKNGDVVSSTTFNNSKSLVGDNYSFREYFTEAIKGSSYTFTALGVATKKRGIYYSSPVVSESGEIIGVIVIKLDAESIDHNLAKIPQSIYLIDNRNFVFASNRKEAILKPISEVMKQNLSLSKATSKPKDSIFSFNPFAPTHGFTFVENDNQRSLYRADLISMGNNNWWVLGINDEQNFMPSALLLVFILGTLCFFALLNAMLFNYFRVRKSNELAQNANKVKTEFLANMSHEIRTPISGIIGLTEIMLDQTKEESPQTKNLKTIQSLGEHLSTIINDILDYSKIEAGKYTISPESFHLGEFLEHFITPFKLEAQKKGIEIESTVSLGVPEWIYLDRKRLQQILINIVSNALKFTSVGRVTLSVSKIAGQNRLLFLIKDTGIGIAKDQYIDLFKPFTQADASTSKVYGGTGLGLTISKKLCELMGGSISYSSELGIGTEFRIELPYELMGANKQSEEELPQVSINEVSVLIVDDNEINLQVAKAIVSKFKPKRILTCTNGSEAIALFKEQKPDLILMDCQMPIMSGFEAAQKIRELEEVKEKRTLIVALTANVMNGDKEECLAAGMDEFLPKPLRKNELGKILIKYFSTQTE